MNVSFTEKQKEYIVSQIESGDFQNASEVVRDAPIPLTGFNSLPKVLELLESIL